MLLTGTSKIVHAFINQHLTKVPLYSDLHVTLSMNLLPATSELYLIVSTRGRKPFKLRHWQFDNCRY